MRAYGTCQSWCLLVSGHEMQPSGAFSSPSCAGERRFLKPRPTTSSVWLSNGQGLRSTSALGTRTHLSRPLPHADTAHASHLFGRHGRGPSANARGAHARTHTRVHTHTPSCDSGVHVPVVPRLTPRCHPEELFLSHLYLKQRRECAEGGHAGGNRPSLQSACQLSLSPHGPTSTSSY